MESITAAGRRIEYRRIDPARAARPWIVLLHEGLGSAELWRDLPERLNAATECGVLVYSRYGHGFSEVLGEAREPSYMHDEARIALPDILRQLEIARPVLVGQSDGASIALIAAGSGAVEAAGIVVEAPHLFVEAAGLRSIALAGERYATDLRARMARYHADADATFWGWNRIWLDARFRDWTIEAECARITAPVLAIQGADDEYGTLGQIDRLRALAVGARVDSLTLAACGHAPHRDRPDAVIPAIAAFCRSRQ